MRQTRINIIEHYLDGLRRKDLSQVAFAPDVTFRGPTTALLEGKETVRQYLESTFPLVEDVRVHFHVVEHDHIVTAFDFITIHGVIAVLDHFIIKDGMLQHIRPYFDPRPLIACAPKQS